MTMADNTTKLRVAIVGGGLVGLSFALYLHQLGKCELSIYEATEVFGTVGAGFEIGHNAMKVYEEMGLADTVYHLAKVVSGDASNIWFDVLFGDGRNGTNPICTVKVPVANTKIHRADGLELLVSRIPAETVFLSKRLESYEPLAGGTVMLNFTDGTAVEADVLVGADGIKSITRKVMYGDKANEGDPVWSGCIAYRNLLPMETVVSNLGESRANRPNVWIGKSRHIIQYPVSRGRSVNMALFVQKYGHGRYPEWEGGNWSEVIDASEVLKDFEGYTQPLQNLLRSMEKPLKWAIFEVPPLPSFVSGNIALIGDAAHAAIPHQGNGASQGIEDVHVLANLLSHTLCTRATAALALKAYDAVRRPRSQRLQQTSYAVGELYHGVSPAGEDGAKIAEVVGTMMDWIWHIDINEQRDRALGLFEESLRNLRE